MRRSESWVVLVLLLAGSALVYGPALDSFFVSDDFFFLPRPPAEGAGEPSRIENSRPLRPHRIVRPMLHLTFRVDHQLWGFNPIGYHLSNLLLHVLNAWLVFFLLRQFTGSQSEWAPRVGALFFALYARHGESVSWISGRSDLLCTFLYLLGLLLFVRSLKPKKGRGFFLGAALLSFGASLLSKEMSLTFPGVVFGYGWLIHASERRFLDRFRIATLQSLPFALPLLFYLFVRFQSLGQVVGGYTQHEPSVRYGLVQILMNLAGFCIGALVPGNIPLLETADYFLSNPVLLAVALLLTSTLAALVVIRLSSPLLFFGIFWFFICLIPVMNLRVNLFYTQGERFLYLPSIGLCFMLAALVLKARDWSRNSKRWVASGVVALILFHGLSLRYLNHNWEEAGRITGAILSDLDSIQSRETRQPFLILAAPDSFRGAYVLRNGLRHALRKMYGYSASEASAVEIASFVGLEDVEELAQIRWSREAETKIIGESPDGKYSFKFAYSSRNKVIPGQQFRTRPLELNRMAMAQRISIQLRKPDVRLLAFQKRAEKGNALVEISEF